MNELNYAILSACQRLADNGIILETDMWWEDDDGEWRLIQNCKSLVIPGVPAPSLDELWRGLPEDGVELISLMEEWINEEWGISPIDNDLTRIMVSICRDINDLCSFLIWVKGKEK